MVGADVRGAVRSSLVRRRLSRYLETPRSDAAKERPELRQTAREDEGPFWRGPLVIGACYFSTASQVNVHTPAFLSAVPPKVIVAVAPFAVAMTMYAV